MRLALAALAALLMSATAACAQPAPPQDAAAFMAKNASAEGVQTLPSGVEYKVVKAGPGTSRHPTPDDYVTVSYEGSLLNGQVFDSTLKTGRTPTFQLKTLIPGWIDAIQQMREGDEWIIWIPPSLGYGSDQTGPIPPGSVLVFRLKLESILGG